MDRIAHIEEILDTMKLNRSTKEKLITEHDDTLWELNDENRAANS